MNRSDMFYEIKTSRNFEKDFASLDSYMQNRVLVVLEKMKQFPFFQAKKLKNVRVGTFRIRVGDYRLRYDVIKKDIFLYRIRHRREV